MKKNLYPESEQLAKLLLPSLALLSKTMQRGAFPKRLTPQQTRIILGIFLRNEPTRLTQLLENSSVTQGTMTIAVQKLEKIGLIIKKKDPNDERAVCLTLSKKGQELAENTQQKIVENFNSICDQISEGDRKELIKSLQFIYGTLKRTAENK